MNPFPLRKLGLPNIGLIVALIGTLKYHKWTQTTLENNFRIVVMPSPSFNSGEDFQRSSWKTTLVDTGTGGSGLGLRSRVELHELITKPPFTGKWISNTICWHKVKGQYQQSRCTKCSKHTRNYCKCCKEIFLFAHCFSVHVLEEERSRTTNHWIQLFEFSIFWCFFNMS